MNLSWNEMRKGERNTPSATTNCPSPRCCVEFIHVDVCESDPDRINRMDK